jgi:ParB family chromosome partitioning protein
MPEYKLIPIELLIEPPAPIRMAIEQAPLDDLRDSIRAIGIKQPLVVVAQEVPISAEQAAAEEDGALPIHKLTGKYEIVAGHRRYLAALAAGLHEIPCMVETNLTVAKEAVMLAENVFRVDLTAAEEGWLYCELAEKFKLTEDALCRMVHQRPEYIYARMDLVRKDGDLAQLVHQRKLGFSVAQQLLRIADPEWRVYFTNRAVEEGATVKQAKIWADNVKREQKTTAAIAAEPAAAETAPPPASDGLVCIFCGNRNNPERMLSLYMHDWELNTMRTILTEAGLGVKEQA